MRFSRQLEEAVSKVRWKRPDGDGWVYSHDKKYCIIPQYRGGRRIGYLVKKDGVYMHGFPSTIKQAKALVDEALKTA